MGQRHYLLVDDKQILGRWFLKGPIQLNGMEVDPRRFTSGRRMKVDDLTQPLTIPLRRRGRALEFTLADFDMPVVHESLAARVSEQCGDDVELFPAAVEGTVERYYIMNITNTVACLDEAKSGVTYWGEQDGRPDLVGKYMIVVSPHVNEAKTQSREIFRIEGWKVAIIVSEDLKDIFSKAKGALLEPA